MFQGLFHGKQQSAPRRHPTQVERIAEESHSLTAPHPHVAPMLAWPPSSQRLLVDFVSKSAWPRPAWRASFPIGISIAGHYHCPSAREDRGESDLDFDDNLDGQPCVEAVRGYL